MIITSIRGGLGNQLFQYSIGRHIALRHDLPLRLDLQWFEEGKWPFYLDKFEIDYKPATEADIDRVIPFGKTGRRIAYKLSFDASLVGQKLFNYYKEISSDPHHWPPFAMYKWQFEPRVLNAGPDAYLEGYWQSEKYFKSIADKLYEEFTVSSSLKGADRDVADAIDNVTAVSVHIRRGDYARRGFALPVDYYPAAMEAIEEQIADPHYFIFGNDHKWAKEHIGTKFPTTYVDHNDAETAVQDLRLMSRCDHNIIANSTFSWWAAWLNKNPSKMVFVPILWHSLKNIVENNLDVIPDRWNIVNWLV